MAYVSFAVGLDLHMIFESGSGPGSRLSPRLGSKSGSGFGPGPESGPGPGHGSGRESGHGPDVDWNRRFSFANL
jgi:hypothetical protein